MTVKLPDAPREGTCETQWRPISEADTETETPILCYTPHTMAVAYFDNGEWWIIGSRGVIEATHWMPLPDPPQPQCRWMQHASDITNSTL